MAKADRIEAAVYQRAAFAAICSPPALMQSPCPTRAEDGVNKFVHRLSSLCPRIKGGIKLKLYAVWPFFGILAGALVLLRVDRIFRIVDVEAPDPRQRSSAIHGLRGLLAFGVFGHHAVVTNQYLRTGSWNYPPSAFYTLLGEVSVAFFFAITGFLFWRKLLDARGTVDWIQLYIGRFFRIAPLYLVAVGGVLLVVMARTDFELREPPHLLFGDVARWLTLGILGQPDVNGYEKTGLLMAGVTWTLRYEWLYYFSLPMLAPLAATPWHLQAVLGGLALTFAAYALDPSAHALYASLFLCGMIAASLRHAGIQMCLEGRLGLAIAIFSLGILFAGFHTAKGIVQVVLIGIVFHVLSSGNTVLGILGIKPVRRLGEMSYSVYLLHGLVLSGVFAIVPIKAFALQSNGRYWLTIALCGFLVILVACLGCLLVERPGMQLGRKVALKTRRRLAL